MKLWMKIMVAMGLGVLVGLVIGPSAAVLKPIGTIFLRMISMIIVPLVIASMTVGITSIHDPAKLGRVGTKTMGIYILSTIIAIVLGLFFAEMFQPGSGLSLGVNTPITLPPAPPLTDLLVAIIPKNPVEALAKQELIQIIVFSLFLGISINFAGAKGKPLLDFMQSLADVMYRLTSIVMEFSPFGVFAIMAAVTGEMGKDALLPMVKFLGVYLLACVCYFFLVHMTIIVVLARLNPMPFLRGMSDAISVAFSTCSSSATLPVLMHCAQENLGVSTNMSRFVLPLGAAINMNGTAIFQGMAALFIAQAYGIMLDWHQVVTVVVTATLATLGAAGVPGSGFIMLSVIFGAVGLPIEGLAILAGIDRLRDMISTTMNIMGDGVIAVYIAKQEGELDEHQYYHNELVELETND